MSNSSSDHPLRQTALRVFFGCFVGGVVLAIIAAVDNHAPRKSLFRLVALAVGFIAVCSVLTYIRPRGIPAFITSTAYVGLFLIAGVFIAGSYLIHFSGQWDRAVIVAILVGWFALGVYRAREAHRGGRYPDQPPKSEE